MFDRKPTALTIVPVIVYVIELPAGRVVVSSTGPAPVG